MSKAGDALNQFDEADFDDADMKLLHNSVRILSNDDLIDQSFEHVDKLHAILNQIERTSGCGKRRELDRDSVDQLIHLAKHLELAAIDYKDKEYD